MIILGYSWSLHKGDLIENGVERISGEGHMSFKKGFGSSQGKEVSGCAAKCLQVVPGRANSVMKAQVSERRWAAFLDPASSMTGMQK